MTSFIPFNKPFVAGNELAYIQEAIANGHLSGNGPFTKIGQVSHEVDTFTDALADDGQDYDWSVNALY